MAIQANLSEAVRQVSDPMGSMQRVADQALAAIGHADGTLIALKDQPDSILYVCGAGRLSPHVGLRIGLDRSLSGLSITTKQLVSTDDSSADSRVDAEACRRLGVRSSICVPLVHRNEAFGVLNVSSASPRAFTVSDQAVMRHLAEFVGAVVAAAADIHRVTRGLFAASPGPDAFVPHGADRLVEEEIETHFVTNVLSPHVAHRLGCRSRIERMLDDRAFSIVLQPVLRLRDRKLLGYEALARFEREPLRTPDKWFAEAHEVGLGLELELAAIERALSYRPLLPAGVYLAVNAGPLAVSSPELLDLVRTVGDLPVVVELTEHAAVDDYSDLTAALRRVRATGARLAIDDTGAGISSLAHILELSPDIIKLDRALTTGIDRDPVRRALAASLVRFAGEIGADIVAEGIETPEELTTLQSLGIWSGQGFYLGRPAPLSAVSTQAAAAI